MSKLANETGLSVATIKFYLREGLLHEGEKSGPNQALYDITHIRRLALIRALTVVGGLTVASTREVLKAIDSDRLLPEVFEVAQNSVSAQTVAPAGVYLDEVDRLLEAWTCTQDNPGRALAADVLKGFDESGLSFGPNWVEVYKSAALMVAEADLDEVAGLSDREAQARLVVVGTVLGDRLFAALRRLAQQHVTARRFGQLGD